jgi:glycosyltransferase involved in cell wall biosynthesis
VVTPEAIPDDALVIASCPLDGPDVAPERVVAVAHGVNPAYRAFLAAGGYASGVAVSAAARAAFPPGVPVETIYNGVELARLIPTRPREQVRRELGIRDNATVVGFVGRWMPGKNPLAAAQAASTVPGGVALYVGPHEQDPALVAAASALADCRFILPENAEDIGDLYAVMDACVVASRTEGFGLTMAEAWCCGVPVVATRVGVALEHPELIAPLPFDPGPTDLRTALDLALSPARAPILAEARKLVLARFRVEQMVQGWRTFLAGRLGAAAAEPVQRLRTG